ncbi:MAG TPA: BTAD domain-containing putative transcriptional regulator [Chloroflexota bacterium]
MPKIITAPLKIQLLGRFRVTVGPVTLEERDWHLRKAAMIVKLLALAPNHRLHREQVIDLLWPELASKAAENNLHHALHVARRTLDPSGTMRALRLEEATVVLHWPAEVWTDVEAFETSLAAARRSRVSASYRRALALYTGDLLPGDRYEDWAADRRVALHTLFVAGQLELAACYKAEGEYGEAIEALQRAVTAEPALEEGHVELMRLYARAGQRQQAIRQYEQLKTSLARELDVEPEAATRALYSQILAGTIPDVGVEGASSERSRNRRHNIATPLSSFVGRDEVVTELLDLAGRCRLLTLTGAGGAGKTRLAGYLGYQLIPEYEDGVWMVELASLSDGLLIAQEVARALSIPERPGESPHSAIVAGVAQKRLLLLLDNCEHLIESCAAFAQLLLRSCPLLHMIVTSREPLNVPGEVTYVVPPLSLPDLRSVYEPEQMAKTEAVGLFLDRARSRQPGFALTPANAAAVARICRQVDGLPLAIELAASRVGVLSVEGIADRLVDALAFLTGGSRTVDPRQQTLRGALDWSYDLLSEPERALFWRLSVFAGGWTLESAEAIGASSDTGSESVLDLLTRLVDKSLVVADLAVGDTVRYTLLEPVRQYARLHLARSGEVEWLERLHAEHFAALAQAAEDGFMGPEQAVWFNRLDQEHYNLRGALRHSIDRAEDEIGLRIMGTSWRYWAGHGHTTEGRTWLAQLFTLPESATTTPAVRAAAFHAAGALAYYQGDYTEAAAYYERELSLLRALGDLERMTILLSNLALVVKEQGDYDRAWALHEEGLTLALEIGSERGQAANLNNMGILQQDKGNYERAAELHDRALVIQRQKDDRRGIMITLNNLGAIALERGRLDRVTDYAEGALAIAHELGHIQSSIVAVMNLGLVAQEEGDFRSARERYHEGIQLAEPIGDKRRMMECLEHLAALACAERQYRRVAMLNGAVAAMRTRSGIGQSPPDRPRLESAVQGAREALGNAEFETTELKGAALTTEDALQYALTREDDETTADSVPLTRREREIAELVTRGFTNRQIAEDLVIAERTVDTHLRNILRKLGVSSRTQISMRLS